MPDKAKTETLQNQTRRDLLMSGLLGASAMGALGALGAKSARAAPMHAPSQPIFTMQQLCYVVDDLDAALKFWTEKMKVGPFFLLEHVKLEDQIFRGRPADEKTDITVALGNTGALQIELAFQHNDTPSVYKEEWLNKGRTGVHHFGFIPEDYEANFKAFVDMGFEPAFQCNIAGSPLCYFDFLDTLGHYVEFWENSDLYRNIFRATEEAARNWDGSNPVRPWT